MRLERTLLDIHSRLYDMRVNSTDYTIDVIKYYKSKYKEYKNEINRALRGEYFSLAEIRAKQATLY